MGNVTLEQIISGRSEEWERDCALMAKDRRRWKTQLATTPIKDLLNTNNLDIKRCLVDVQYVDMFTRLRSITHAVHNNAIG